MTALALLIRRRRSLMLKHPRRRKRLPRQVIPRAIERAYAASMKSMLNYARELTLTRLRPELERLVLALAIERGDSNYYQRAGLAGPGSDSGFRREPQNAPPFIPENIRADANTRRVSEILKAVGDDWNQAFPRERLEAVTDRFGRRISDHQKTELHKQLQAAAGVDVFAAEPNLLPRFEAFTSENVGLITTLPQRALAETEQRVLSGLREGRRTEDLAAEINERFDVGEARAEVIARDQTMKLYGELNQVRQEELGVDGYIWRTSLDERVRGNPSGRYPNADPSHWDREGVKFSWDDPPEDGHPGFPIQCRCWAEPNLEEVLSGLEET